MFIITILSIILLPGSTSSLRCYQCRSDKHPACAIDWNSTEKENLEHKEYEAKCRKGNMVCTKKIGMITRSRKLLSLIFQIC